MNNDTKCVRAGYIPGNGEPRQIPIVQSTTFRYTSSEEMGQLFDLEKSGYFYTRLQNPTNDHVAARIAELEGGVAAMLTSSGQAANFFAVFNICTAGDHFVSTASIRRNFQPLRRHHEEDGHRLHVRRSGRERGGAGKGIPPEHQVRVRRNAFQPGRQGARHRKIRAAGA